MAAASQAVPGEFDSRHLLQREKHTHQGVFFSLEQYEHYVCINAPQVIPDFTGGKWVTRPRKDLVKIL